MWHPRHLVYSEIATWCENDVVLTRQEVTPENSIQPASCGLDLTAPFNTLGLVIQTLGRRGTTQDGSPLARSKFERHAPPLDISSYNQGNGSRAQLRWKACACIADRIRYSVFSGSLAYARAWAPWRADELLRRLSRWAPTADRAGNGVPRSSACLCWVVWVVRRVSEPARRAGGHPQIARSSFSSGFLDTFH